MFKSKAWNIAIIAYFTTRINLFLLAFYFTYALTRKPVKGHWLYHDGEVHSNWFVNAFQRWDSYWFLNIVREGYQWHGIINQVTNHPGPDVEETNITPFPLYPLLIKIVTYFVQDPSIAGLIISQICFIISLGLFYKLVRLDFNHETSVLAVWFFAVFPWNYAYSAIYSESLFFMCTVGSVLAMRKGEIFYAGILGMASALTRLPGILLFVLLIIETWPKNTKNLKLNFNFVYIYLIKENFIWILLVPFGVILYFSYLWYLTGEPFAYFIAQKGWEKELVTPLHHIIKWLEKPLNFKDYLQLFPALFLTLIVIYGYNRIRFSYYTYLLIYYLIIFSSSNLLGFGRYASSIFPLFLILVVISKNYSIFNYLFLITFSMLSPVIYGIWFGWYNSF